jgi:hypothetical protein
MLPALPRQSDVDEMIEGKYYFVLHAPRQSGKTTYLLDMVDKINSEGKYYALYCSLEPLDRYNNRKSGIDEILNLIFISLGSSNIKNQDKLLHNFSPPFGYSTLTKIQSFLNYLCNNLDKELIIFFDEADCLSGELLVPFLRQIRLGYNLRDRLNNKFPRSMALIGLRDIRDYLAQVRPGSASRGVASPFNIKKEALTLANFTRSEIGTLYLQHTEASGQIFEDSAIDRAWYWSEGQPWLVNALAYEAVVKILKNDYTQPITVEIIDQAARAIILNRPVHIDSLMERLKEPRVRPVIDAVIAGATLFDDEVRYEDIQYVLDLGILKVEENEVYQPSNPIYGEIIIRTLTRDMERRVPKELEGRWTDGRKLDMTGLLTAFQKYWRQNSEMLGAPDRLTESTPHLVCFTFIQRVLNGDVEEINREYALGRKRVDLYALYKGVSYPVELKTKSPKANFSENDLNKSLKQLRSYMDKCGSKQGWLVIFDLDWVKSWDEKITWETTNFEGVTIHIIGC